MAKVDPVRESLVEEIKQKISERLKDFLENNFEMFRVFDVAVWNVDEEDIPNETKKTRGNIECIYEICKHLLDIYGFDIKAAKKEWKRVKRIVIDKFMKLQENPTMWCRFLTTYGHLYDNIAMILEIMIVLLCSSAVVERGFSTLQRNLTATRSSLGNTRLDAVLVIKTNLQ